MPLTPAEAAYNFTRIRATIDILEDALRKDADGKVRVTGPEARKILLTLPMAAIQLVVDILD